MKKFGFIFSAALFALLCVSCNKELSTEDPVKGPEKPSVEKVHISFTAGIGTKASVEEGESTVDIKWSADDHIAVWDGTEWCDFAATTVDGATAIFEGEITPDESFAKTSFKAVYPFSAVSDRTSSAISVSVPAEQIVPAGGVVDPKALVSVATCSEEGLLSFEQVCALVKVGLTQAGMSAITLEGTGLAGTVVCADNGSVTSATAPAAKITLSAAAESTLNAADYYIAVLPGTSAPLKVGMVRESDGYTGVRTATSVSFTQGSAKIYIKDSALSFEYNIYTPKQLLECAKKWNSSFKDLVNLCADIDMSSIAEDWPVRDFAGTLNGNHKRIYNYTYTATEDSQDAAFIKSISGTVKDIDFGTVDGSTYDGNSLISLHNTGTNTGWFYAGLFVRFNNGAQVSGIANYIPIEVKTGTTVKSRVGGIVGVVATAATSVLFKDCVNYGSVSNKSTSFSAASNLGGIIGRCDVAIEASNVINKGDITCLSPRIVQLGGFSSGLYGGSKLEGCMNYGDITYEVGALTATTYIGGLIGHASIDYTNTSTLSNCENFGSLRIIDSGSANLYCGGVAGFVRNVRLEGCKNHGAIHSEHKQVSRLGGIVGTMHAASVLDKCENDGSITLVQNSETNAWQGVGGIVGDTENTKPVITNCINTVNGVMNATFYSKTTHNFKCCAGGIIGALGTVDNLSGNINYASISGQNVGPDSPYCYVGGIVGNIYSGATVTTVSGNFNYGLIWNKSTNAELSAAGGIYGCMAATSATTSGDKNFGSVQGTNAGAVAGVNSATISATICDAVTVNGVAKADAANEATWLCPSNTGTITPSYVAHSDSE